ncbi:MAG: F0F1 ATP synthase subunit A [Thermoguttaceae bacterium]|jgi:F-type H+-transporting ATPase subunit a
MDLDFAELANHVRDGAEFELPGLAVRLPKLFGFQLTRFMVLEVVAGLLMLAIFIPLARRLRTGSLPRGPFRNVFEAMLLFIRDEVARPAIGSHDAQRFLPFLWTAFFFILFCNLLGIVPWAGSPTGALTVTVALAGLTFCVVVGAGMGKFGPLGYLKSLVPHMHLPLVMAFWLVPMIFFIELAGLLIRHVVLAVRLLANMFAGHLVLAVMLSFILATGKMMLVVWLGITVCSVLGSVALTFLELFVGFLQAYIFTFLAAIFIGMAVHPH